MKTLSLIVILLAMFGFGLYEAFYANIPVINQMGCFFISCLDLALIITIIVDNLTVKFKKHKS